MYLSGSVFPCNFYHAGTREHTLGGCLLGGCFVWHNDLRRLRRHEPGNTRKRIRTVSVKLILPPTLSISLILLQLRPHDTNLEQMIKMACMPSTPSRSPSTLERAEAMTEVGCHTYVSLYLLAGITSSEHEWIVLRLTMCTGVKRETVRSD